MTEPFVALAIYAFVSTASPGGATSLATASGAQFGFLKSLPLISGVAVALALLVAVSGTGLSATVLAIPSLSVAMRLVGSAYLVWLAIKVLTAGSPQRSASDVVQPIGFLGGAMLLVVNPKAWGMAVGVAGSFSTLSDSPFKLALIFGSVFLLAAGISLSAWVQMGFALSKLLSAEWQWHAFNGVMASLLALSITSLWI